MSSSLNFFSIGRQLPLLGLTALTALCAVNCATIVSPDEGEGAGTGGSTSSGGNSNVTPSGGNSGTGSGGTTSSGGSTSSGGTTSSGGATASGGSDGTGGRDASNDECSVSTVEADCNDAGGCHACNLDASQVYVCEVDTALTECSAGCTDVQSDPMHCGDCDTVCDGATPYCVSGACSADGFRCNAGNSVNVPHDTPTNLAIDACAAFSKSATTLQLGNWSGSQMTLQLWDSGENSFSDVMVPSGGWTPVSGVANGTMYFYISALGAGSSAQIQVAAW